MPAQLATRPVFWAPRGRGRPAATRARAPGTRAPAPGRRPPGRRPPGRRPPGRAPGNAVDGPRHQIQATRSTGPGTRSAAAAGRTVFVDRIHKHQAPGHTNTNTGPGTRSRHRAPGRADHGRRPPGRRRAAPGPRSTGHQGARWHQGGTIRGARFRRRSARITGRAQAATRSAGYPENPDGI